MERPRNRICIAILALGGQGGGVLADWIQTLGRSQGWVVQGTSVPGVAQRTGSTVYYVELAQRLSDRVPIMAQMPVPGDVDVVIASELMEAGRAMLRGFVSPDRTILITSTHRIYAMAEKTAMGDGRQDGEAVIEAALREAKRVVAFDMEAATARSKSVISSVMFGALAGSGALPFEPAAFAQAIEESAIAVSANLAGFAAGRDAAKEQQIALPRTAAPVAPPPTTLAGRALERRIRDELPAPAQANAVFGVQRLMDYQDAAYAALYLDRLRPIAKSDQPPFAVTAETARHLALWMSYEDAVRVADLKIRASRWARVGDEVRLEGDQLLSVTEFMHPRLREVCDILPAGLGGGILARPWLVALLDRFFRQGRHVETSSLSGFLLLRLVAALRPLRRRSLRWQEEQPRIDQWLGAVARSVTENAEVAFELVRCQGLIKGYGDTFDRGWRNFQTVMRAADALPRTADGAAAIARLKAAAQADDQGTALAAALEQQGAAAP